MILQRRALRVNLWVLRATLQILPHIQYRVWVEAGPVEWRAQVVKRLAVLSILSS